MDWLSRRGKEDCMKDKERYTHYEKVRILSSRALQISQGAPVMVSIPSGTIDPLEIAKLEWEKGVIPIDTKNKES